MAAALHWTTWACMADVLHGTAWDCMGLHGCCIAYALSPHDEIPPAVSRQLPVLVMQLRLRPEGWAARAARRGIRIQDVVAARLITPITRLSSTSTALLWRGTIPPPYL